VRTAIYAQIAGANCPQMCSNFLNVSEQAIPKSTLSQHFKILREAGLIRGERRGVEMHNTTRCGEIEGRFPGLLGAIIKAHRIQAQQRQKASTGNTRRSTSPRKRP
jgi:DNA-binding transcriptional ArsR family regulator